MASSLCLSPMLSAAQINEADPTTKDNCLNESLRCCKTLNQFKQLHCQITKKGLDQIPSTVTMLVNAGAEIGTSESLDYARKAFELFKEDVRGDNALFMLNSLIRGYSSAGHGGEAILLYVRMLVLGFTPNHYTFPFLLSGCTKIAAFCEGIQFHGSVIKMGLEQDVFVQNSLIHFYAKCGHMDHARKMFEGMSERNVVSWTSLICGYARGNRPKEAVCLFFEMVEAGIRPSSVTMVCVISACSKLQDLDMGDRVCAYIGEVGLKLNTVMVNALVDMYMKCGKRDAAKRLFDECVDRNLILYNTILSNYARQGLAREALAILDEMLQQGPRPDRVTMLSAISASAQLVDLLFGKMCHGYVIRNGLEGWDSIGNVIIDMYMKCGKPEMAYRVFDLMPNKTAVSWNSLMAGFIRNGDVDSAWEVFNQIPEGDVVFWNTMISGLVQKSLFEEAIELFRVMQGEGVKADRVTMMGIASACGYLGAPELAKWVHTYTEKNEIPCDIRLSTALVDMFARCGDPQSAMQVFDKMTERDVFAWTAAIGAMAMEGNGKGATELFYQMLVQGVKPDVVVFVQVLTACSHGGLVEEGLHIFSLMKDHGIFPKIEHYGCMVDLLGRAGLLREAFDLIKSMPMEPNDVVWASLLAACRVHRNVEMATYAEEQINELAPQRAGVHVLLSNIYASAGKWNDVARVRLNLREKGVRKLPGSSSIQVNGIINEFTSGDESHPEMTHIALMLQEMSCRFSDAGHIPDLSNVLLDVDEQEKDYLLSRHSEKLAIAFGLIATDRSMPIRVAKNLRMCSDCHSFTKMASTIYDREIVVRDNNRFHFFRQGLCSCHDYW